MIYKKILIKINIRKFSEINQQISVAKRGRPKKISKALDEEEEENIEIICICKKKASGNMIECENNNCKIGWFHFKCVKIKKVPKNEWLCPYCIKNSQN